MSHATRAHQHAFWLHALNFSALLLERNKERTTQAGRQWKPFTTLIKEKKATLAEGAN